MNNFPLLKNWIDLVSRYSDKVKDFLPAEKSSYSVGLDIGTSSVKLVQIQKDGRDFKISGFGIEPIKGNKEEAVRKVLAASNISAKKVNISVSGQGVILRYIQTPKLSLDDLKASIAFESDKYIPFPMEEVNTDCYIIRDLPQESKMLVLVAAVKKDLIEQRISLLEKLGLIPEVVSIDSVALANVFNVFCNTKVPVLSKDHSGKVCQTVGLLNIGGTFSSLNILDRGLPFFTRDIFIGGEDVTKRLVNQLGIDEVTADKMKSSEDADENKIIGSCENILSNLATEIRFSFDYFETENNLPISLLYVTGGGSYLKGINTYLQQNLGIEVKTWDPLSGLEAGPGISAEDLKKQANKMGIAIGLALYQND